MTTRNPLEDSQDAAPPGRERRAWERVVGHFQSRTAGPTLIVVGGVHGNEPAGVHACRRVVETLERARLEVRGEFLALAGNTRALALGERFVDRDLNRHWTHAHLGERPSDEDLDITEDFDTVEPDLHTVEPDVTVEPSVSCASGNGCSEDLELQELLAAMEPALARARGEVYVLDLHTTSGSSYPFATVGDTLRNRAFAAHIPVPIVLGLEEELHGTMLEYINGLGHVTMGFEAGQHDKPASVDNHESVVWIALASAGVLRAREVPDLSRHRENLKRACLGASRVLEIRYRHAVVPEDGFHMEEGHESFDLVDRGQLLGHDRNGPVYAPESGLLLLPLYQGLGDDGFFIARRVRRFWLRVSSLVRHLRLPRLVTLLPGIRRHPHDPSSLLVDTHVARWYPLEVFHLLGFRRRRWVDEQLVVTRRMHDLARGR